MGISYPLDSAASGVFGTGTAWPDLAAAVAMPTLAISAGWSALAQARREPDWEATR